MACESRSRQRIAASLAVMGALLVAAGAPALVVASEDAPPVREITVRMGEELPEGLQKLLNAWSPLGDLAGVLPCGSRKSLWAVFPSTGRIAVLDSRGDDLDQFAVRLTTDGQTDTPVACAADSGELVLLGRRAVWIVEDDKIGGSLDLPFTGKSVADVSGDVWVSTVPVLPVARGNRLAGDAPPSIAELEAGDEPLPMLIRLVSSDGFDTLEDFPEGMSGGGPFHAIAWQYAKAPFVVAGRDAVYTVDPLTLEIKKYGRSGTFKGILREPSTERSVHTESAEDAAAVAESAGAVADEKTGSVAVRPAVLDACWWEDHLLLLENASDPGGRVTLSVVDTSSGDLVPFSLPAGMRPRKIAASRDLIVIWTFDGKPAVIDGDTLEGALRPPLDQPMTEEEGTQPEEATAVG